MIRQNRRRMGSVWIWSMLLMMPAIGLVGPSALAGNGDESTGPAGPGKASAETTQGRGHGPSDCPRVLIIASYERFARSTSLQEDAARQEMMEAYPCAQIRADYLISGVMPTPELTPELRAKLATEVLEKWRDLRPNVIVTIDTLAFDLMTGPSGQEVFPDVPLVFSGVTWDATRVRERIAADPGGATGVLERLDLKESVALMRILQPDLKKLLLVGGVNERSASLREETRRQLEAFSPGIELVWAKSPDIRDVIDDEAANLGEGGAALYLAHYDETPGRDAGGTWARWPVPAYAVFESNIADGLVGGLVVSGASQGRRAGEMASGVLAGQPVVDIALDETSARRVILRHDNLQRWGMLDRVPKGAMVVAMPTPWVERWGNVLAIGTGIAVLQSLAIVGLLMMRSCARRAESETQRERDRFRATLEGSTDGMWEWDVVNDRTYWSPPACKLLGLSDDGAVTATGLWNRLLHPEDRERTERALRVHLETGAVYAVEYRLRVRDGSYRWFRSRGVAIRNESGKPTRMCGTLVDIDALVQAETRLRESEARYRLIADHSQDFIVHFHRDGRRLYRSPVSERVFPLSEDQRRTNDHGARVHPDDRRNLEEVRQKVLSGQHCRFEMRAIDADDRLRWMDMQVSPVIESDGSVDTYVCYARDITERKQAEKAIREAEERYSAMFARHPYPMWVYDVDSLRFLEVNQAAIDKYGWTRDEFLQMSILDVRPEAERERVRDFVRSRDPADPNIGMWVHRTKDGRILDVRVSTHAIPWKPGWRARVATMIDQTEKIAAERWQSRQREIMERVASGAPLQTILESIAKQVQEQSPGVIASVLLLNDDGRTVHTAAAPDLPAAYSKGIDGMEIGPSVGSCGRAMYTAQRVIVSDIATDAKWAAFRDFAIGHGLRACWSDPIRTSDGTVIGSLAMYARIVREPGPSELDVISSASHMAGIAIERDHAQAAMRISEARFRQIFETAQEGIWVVDSQWRTELANDAMGRMLGVEASTMLGRAITEFMDEEGIRLAEDYRSRRERGQSETHEFKFIRADGRPLWAIVATNPIRRGNREFDGALAMVTDITDRRAMEDALRMERRVFLSGPAIAWRWRAVDGWPVEYVSENVSTLGYTALEFMSGGLPYASIVHPDDLDRVAAEIRDHLQNHRHVFEQEYRVRTKDGRWRTLADHTLVDLDESGLPRYFVGYAIDVTERRVAEDRLRESERTNRALIAALPDLIFRMHRDGRYLTCHTNTPERLIVPPEQFLGRTPGDVLPKPLAEQCVHHLEQLFKTGEPQTYEYDIRREHRQRTRWEVRMTRSADDEALLLVRDVTIERDNERKLRQSEARLSMLVNSAPVGVISWNTDFTVSAWNPAAERIFGFTAQQAIGRHGSFIVPEASKQYVDELWRSLIQRTGGVRGSNENMRADGRVISCEWYNTPLVDGQGRVIGVASIVEDVTERRLAERRHDLILRELDHRVKNNLAAVISLAEQTGRSVSTYPEFSQRFVGRLNAMARMHSALARTRWKGAELRLVVSQTLEAFSPGESDRLVLEGPEVMVPPRAAQALTMALNELATNAAKYGALSGPEGRVSVRWSLMRPRADEPRVELQWVESDGPPVATAPPRGFGSELIEGAIAHELRGKVQLRFPPEGVMCEMSFPLRSEPVLSIETPSSGEGMHL